jgi:hypothetical protein
MIITVAPRGILQIDDARIIFRNFSGVGSQFNREGDRNFSVVIPTTEIADDLINQGWNVKIKPAREDGDDPFMHLPVKVKFNTRGPKVWLVSGCKRVPLDEQSIGIIDDIDIARVDLDIRPYDWNVNGKSGRSAYLHSMEVVQELDRFAARFEEETIEVPFE